MVSKGPNEAKRVLREAAKADAIAAEVALDGVYIVRTIVPAAELDAEHTVVYVAGNHEHYGLMSHEQFDVDVEDSLEPLRPAHTNADARASCDSTSVNRRTSYRWRSTEIGRETIPRTITPSR